MLGLMHDHPYVFTPTIAKIMLPVWVCLLVSTVRAIRSCKVNCFYGAVTMLPPQVR